MFWPIAAIFRDAGFVVVTSLCKIGGEAKDVLPRLMVLERDPRFPAYGHQVGSFHRHAWDVMMVGIGNPVKAFGEPPEGFSSRELYWDSLQIQSTKRQWCARGR